MLDTLDINPAAMSPRLRADLDTWPAVIWRGEFDARTCPEFVQNANVAVFFYSERVLI